MLQRLPARSVSALKTWCLKAFKNNGLVQLIQHQLFLVDGKTTAYYVCFPSCSQTILFLWDCGYNGIRRLSTGNKFLPAVGGYRLIWRAEAYFNTCIENSIQVGIA